MKKFLSQFKMSQFELSVLVVLFVGLGSIGAVNAVADKHYDQLAAAQAGQAKQNEAKLAIASHTKAVVDAQKKQAADQAALEKLDQTTNQQAASSSTPASTTKSSQPLVPIDYSAYNNLRSQDYSVTYTKPDTPEVTLRPYPGTEPQGHSVTQCSIIPTPSSAYDYCVQTATSQ